MTAAAAAAVAAEGLLSPQVLLPEHRPTVVLVDPLSTGVLLQKRVFALGYQVILVWSDRSQPASQVRHFERSGHGKEDFAAIICHEHEEQLPETLDKILAVATTNIVAVMCGSEHGVLLEDAVAEGLCERLGVSHIKSSGMFSRNTKVDKHAQANTVRKAGLAAVRERLARTEEDVQAFLEECREANGTPPTSFVVKVSSMFWKRKKFDFVCLLVAHEFLFLYLFSLKQAPVPLE